MYASKEECQKAREGLKEVLGGLAADDQRLVNEAIDFLWAAERKLPTEASYKREKNKRLAKEYGSK